MAEIPTGTSGDRFNEDHSAVFMKVATPPAQRIGLVTTTEAQLADLGRLLATGLQPLIDSSPDQPLLVSIGGTYKSGHGILPEALRDTLLGKDAALKGTRHQAEIWTGEKPGLEVALVNASQQDPIPFIKAPHGAGVIFIQNDAGHDVKTGFEISIESPESSLARRAPLSGMDDQFAAEAGNPGLRYVEIKVTEPRILLSGDFRRSLQQAVENYPSVVKALNATPGAIPAPRPDTPKPLQL